MKPKNLVITTILIFCACVFSNAQKVYADTITPNIYEQLVSASSKTSSKVSYTNDSNKSVEITPQIYPYDPKTESLIDNKQYVFVRMDNDSTVVKSNTTSNFNYEIVPPANLEPGTYFNLIVFKKTLEKGPFQDNNSLGTVDSLSHLVVIHIGVSDKQVLGISSNYAQISMEIVDKGIPFLKPMAVKYIYQNTSNYVLKPKGEIQTYDAKSSYPPEYMKINEKDQKLYPGDRIEETIYINKWHITDVLFGKQIVGRFYNGLDSNVETKELTQNNLFIYLGFLGVFLFLVILLIRSTIQDRRKKTTK